MKLELGDGTSFQNPDRAAIADALSRLDEKSLFAALGETELTYILAVGDRERGFAVEYHDGDHDIYYNGAQDSYPLEAVIALFEQYATGNDHWRLFFNWERQEVRRGCLGELLRLALRAVGIGRALVLG